MTPILLTPSDLALASVLLVANGVLSLLLGLGLHRQLAIAGTRMVIQLALVGYMLRLVFAAGNPALTLLIVVVMALVATREIAARPRARLVRFGNFVIAGAAVGVSTGLTAMLALTTAIRPQPWWDPHYAIPLAGIVLGSVLNSASLSLDAALRSVVLERLGIEAQLALGIPYRQAMRPIVRDATRIGLLPVVNQMTAAGVITLPGIMTGQILAGLDPLEAVKYQILLMFLLSGSSGLAGVLAARMTVLRLTDGRQRLRLDLLRQ
jgi:putative ABC transport system permease protein